MAGVDLKQTSQAVCRAYAEPCPVVILTLAAKHHINAHALDPSAMDQSILTLGITLWVPEKLSTKGFRDHTGFQ